VYDQPVSSARTELLQSGYSLQILISEPLDVELHSFTAAMEASTREFDKEQFEQLAYVRHELQVQWKD
jgi:hypothetical protein